MGTYDKREVNYKKVHNYSQKTVVKLVKSLDLSSGQYYVEFMCGHGEISKNVLDFCKKKRLKISGALLDKYRKQLPANSQVYPLKTIVGDIIKPVFKKESIDRGVIKIGIHEIPQKDQSKAIYQIYRAMKKGGICIFWELAFKDKEERDTFQNTVREKDRLSGYDDLVKRRHFLTKKEFMDLLNKNGFKKIDMIKMDKFKFNSENWLNNDFKGDKRKLEKFNEFLRKLPNNIKKRFKFKDKKTTISMEFNWPLYKVIK